MTQTWNIRAQYDCYFCKEEITVQELIDGTPVWVELPGASSNWAERRLMHSDCVVPSQVARRLLKEFR